MQETMKMEEQQSFISPKLTLDDHLTMKKLIDEMEKGKESAEMIRNMILDLQGPGLKDYGGDHYKKATLDHHSLVVLTSCVTSLSLMRSFDFDHGDFIRKRKVDHDLMDDYGDDEVPKVFPINSTKDGRGCYKRRKSDEARIEEVTRLRDDGFGWRKYGQKMILNANHPRNYYRCTHKFDQKCLATKQVQQISENPNKYRIIYHGNHTCCNNILKFSPILIQDDDHHSAIVLNFDQKKSHQVNPDHLLFPAAPVKQQYNSPPSDQTATMSTGLSSTSSSSTSTLVSEQSDLISTAEKCCSTTGSGGEGVEDYYRCMLTELEMLHELYAC